MDQELADTAAYAMGRKNHTASIDKYLFEEQSGQVLA